MHQVQIGSHAFTFDNVFGSRGCPSSTIFDECVAPLVDALFHGYNGTVLAYGQVSKTTYPEFRKFENKLAHYFYFDHRPARGRLILWAQIITVKSMEMPSFLK